MPVPALIYVIEQDPRGRHLNDTHSLNHSNSQLQLAAERLHCRLMIGSEDNNSVEKAVRLSPDIMIYSACSLDADTILLFQRLRAEASLCECTFLLMPAGVPDLSECEWSKVGADEILLHDAAPLEITMRLQMGLQLARLRRQNAALKIEMDSYRNQKEQEGDYLNDATAYLVEIAAELQSEVCHSAEREEESVRVAQVDTIAQAAATLRHEINNPLFAITGSAETALKRLRSLQVQYGESGMEGIAKEESVKDFTALISGMERIQRGSERIGKVVQDISATLEASKKDYVEGVPMLELNGQNIRQ